MYMARMYMSKVARIAMFNYETINQGNISTRNDAGFCRILLHILKSVG